MDNKIVHKIVEATLCFVNDYPRAEEWLKAISSNDEELAHFTRKFNHYYEEGKDTKLAILRSFYWLDDKHAEKFRQFIIDTRMDFLKEGK